MTIAAFLAQATAALVAAGDASARLDVLILLEDALGRDRASILAHSDDEIPTPVLHLLNTQIIQRSSHRPLAYIRGKTAFYGRVFEVTPAVLVPRPETETMIELLTRLPLKRGSHIADIGSGSGCLAITAKLEIASAVVDAYDSSKEALVVAHKNAVRHRTAIHFYRNDLLQGISQRYDVILANLPYVPANYTVNDDARHEPRLALFGGDDGLDLYRRFWQQLNSRALYIITESLEEQHAQVAGLAAHAGYQQVQVAGLAAHAGYQQVQVAGLVQLFVLKDHKS